MGLSRKKKTFKQLMDELDNLHRAVWTRGISEKAYAKRKLKIIQQIAKIAKSDAELLTANAIWLQFKQDYGV